ncbi:hypothetical protein [Paracoccus kondratievae]|uniref:Uncharacterized protein n=1 Tax=Paracoccus kondratievae TaxID=135740 RepID=A0AAD3RT15_9RHOB|nr:hypothetical protein [Paracoccus kondratievae]AZV00296.1 hypothetical protein pkon1_p67 [Paracoccus phage vB_PkoS_Pkon1]GLK63452.1 hypothetical protein GCM10017635_09220 [Paracoccus kondratievae]
MTDYKITRREDGATATITAHRYEHDGAGARFYDEGGNLIASFGDQQIASIVPAAIVFGDDLEP